MPYVKAGRGALVLVLTGTSFQATRRDNPYLTLFGTSDFPDGGVNSPTTHAGKHHDVGSVSTVTDRSRVGMFFDMDPTSNVLLSGRTGANVVTATLDFTFTSTHTDVETPTPGLYAIYADPSDKTNYNDFSMSIGSPILNTSAQQFSVPLSYLNSPTALADKRFCAYFVTEEERTSAGAALQGPGTKSSGFRLSTCTLTLVLS